MSYYLFLFKFSISLTKVEILRIKSNVNAIEVIFSWNFLGSFFLVINSLNANTNCPPSKAGKGKAFNTARFTLNAAMNPNKAVDDTCDNSAPFKTNSIK